MNLFRRFIAALLIGCIAATGFIPAAQAGMLPTEVALGAPAERARIGAALERDDVRAQLQAYGVDPAAVQARVAALTDQEAAQLARHIDTLPAGGIVGAIVFVFVLLLVTDILGLTKVFPFTRPVR